MARLMPFRRRFRSYYLQAFVWGALASFLACLELCSLIIAHAYIHAQIRL